MNGEHTAAAIDYTRRELDLTDPQDRDLAAKYNIDSVVLDYLEMETDPAAKAEALAQHAAAVQEWAEAPVYGEESAETDAVTPASEGYEASAAGSGRSPRPVPVEENSPVMGDEDAELYEIIEEYVREVLGRYSESGIPREAEPEVDEDAGEIGYDVPDAVGEMFGTWDEMYGSGDAMEDGTGEHNVSENVTTSSSDTGSEYGIPESAGEMFDTWDSEYGSSGSSGDGDSVDGSVSMKTDTGPTATSDKASASEATA